MFQELVWGTAKLEGEVLRLPSVFLPTVTWGQELRGIKPPVREAGVSFLWMMDGRRRRSRRGGAWLLLAGIQVVPWGRLWPGSLLAAEKEKKNWVSTFSRTSNYDPHHANAKANSSPLEESKVSCTNQLIRWIIPKSICFSLLKVIKV